MTRKHSEMTQVDKFERLCLDVDKVWDRPAAVYEIFRQKYRDATSTVSPPPKRQRVSSRSNAQGSHSLCLYLERVKEDMGLTDKHNSEKSLVTGYWNILGYLVERRAAISGVLPSSVRIYFDDDDLQDDRPHKVSMILSLLLLEMHDDIQDPRRLQISFLTILLGLGGDLATDAHTTLLWKNRPCTQKWMDSGSLVHVCLLHLFQSPTTPHPLVLQRLGRILCLLPNCIPRGLLLFCVSSLTAHPDMVRVELCAKMVLMNVDYWNQPCPPIWSMMSKFPVLHSMLIRLLLRCPNAAHVWLSSMDVSTCQLISQHGLLNTGMFPMLCHQDHRKSTRAYSDLLRQFQSNHMHGNNTHEDVCKRRREISTIYACTQSQLVKMLYRRHLQQVPVLDKQDPLGTVCNEPDGVSHPFCVESIIDRMPCVGAKEWILHYLSFPLLEICVGAEMVMTMEKMQFDCLQQVLLFHEAAEYLQMDVLIMRIQQVLIEMLLSNPAAHVHSLFHFSVEHTCMQMLQDTCVEVACVQPMEVCDAALFSRVLSQFDSRTQIFDDYLVSQ